MDIPKLYRRRLIPDECIYLKDDEILFYNASIIVTRWHALKPKKDLHHGLSCYFLKEGYKISKFYCKNNDLLYWYCDIIDYEYKASEDSYIFRDLLADVIVFPDGLVQVIDLDELSTALISNLLPPEVIAQALSKLDKLLNVIYQNKFDRLKSEIELRE